MDANEPLDQKEQPRRSSPQRLTDTRLQSLIKKKWSKEIADGAVGCLVVRVDASGREATWSIPLRISGQGDVSEKRGRKKKGPKRRYTIGTYPATSIEEARKIAVEMHSFAKAGKDPAEALKKKESERLGGAGSEQQDAAAAVVFKVAELGALFMTEHILSRELSSAPKYQDAFDVHINPLVGEVDANLLTREEARTVMESARVKRDRPEGQSGNKLGGIEAARTVIGVLRHMIEWGRTEKKLTRVDNPCSSLTTNLPKKKRGEVVLSLEESRIVYQAAKDCGYAFGDQVRLQFMNALRLANWAEAQEFWIDRRQALAVIPADHYKSDHVHIVPLVAQAMAIVQSLPTPKTGPYLLSSTGGDTYIQGVSKFFNTRLADQIVANTGERFSKRLTTQTIRRTVATRIAEKLGLYGDKLVKRILGHAMHEVTEIYNRYTYVREMRFVLEEWANELTAGIDEPVVQNPIVASLVSNPIRANNVVTISSNLYRPLRWVQL